MESFIVLGQIPGTHLKITFLFWQIMISGVLGYVALRIALRRRMSTFETEAADEEA